MLVLDPVQELPESLLHDDELLLCCDIVEYRLARVWSPLESTATPGTPGACCAVYWGLSLPGKLLPIGLALDDDGMGLYRC